MPRQFSNVRPQSVVITSSASSPPPFTSKGPISNLTPKERAARALKSQQRVANFGLGGGFGGSLNTTMASHGQFFSPQLSTDFLELPQSLREKREIYRHFYNTDPIVGQSIDLHTELPLSKVRLATPKPQTHPERFKDTHDYANYILWFFTRMCDKIKLFQRLVTMVHHYWLDGGCVTGETLISTPSGERRADEIGLGDQVLTHTGRWRTVEAVQQRAGEDILSLDIARLPGRLNLTREHPIEVVRGDRFEFIETGDLREGDFVRATWPVGEADVSEVSLLDPLPAFVEPCDGGYRVTRTQVRPRSENAARARLGLLSWLCSLQEPVRRSRASIAEELGVPLYTLHNVILTLDQELPYPFRRRVATGPKHGDHTLWLPLWSGEENSWYYEINRDYRFQAPRELPVDADFLYLLGYWLGDGTLTRDTSRSSWGRGVWSVCFGSESNTHRERVRWILDQWFGSERVYERTDRECVSLAVTHNPAFVEWWASQFGCTSKGPNPKRIPNWVMQLPADKQLHLVAGLIDSDGCVSVGTTTNSVVQLSMVSEGLIYHIRDLFLRVGSVPSLRVAPPASDSYIDGQRVQSNGPSYVLTVNDEDESRRLCKYATKADRLLAQSKWVSRHTSYKRVAGQVALLIRGVEGYPDETVYNFQVDRDHTFRAGFVSTHNCFIFAEDSEVDVPAELGYDQKQVGVKYIVTEDGEAKEEPEIGLVEREDRENQELGHYQKEYKGWDRLIIIPIDRVKATTAHSFTDKMRIELIPSDKDRALIEQARSGDEFAEMVVRELPAEVRDYMEQGKLIPLGTDPDEGSFCYYMAGRRGAGEPLGQSILDRVLRTLMYREKLRQAQTQIASRAMTPKRIIWGDRISEVDVMDLREQVDLALVDPDYSIVTNYEVRWEEMGARDRLLDLSSEYEITDKQLYAGLGVTESLLSGETLYSGDRLKLEVINTRYLFLREMVQEYVERYLFEPVSRRKGFVEKNAWGEEVVLYPRLSFTRLPLRDSQDTYDALFNLYNKGSIDISLILEMFNIDADDTRVKLEKDLFTVNDALFNEVLRAIYSTVAQEIVEQTNVAEKIIETLKLQRKPEEEAQDPRF